VGDLFFHRKTTDMTFHLIFLKNELHIVPVRPEQEIAFFQQHGQRILASGDSISEVLRIFNSLPVIIDNGS
jgi:hypothetical protein